MLPDTHGTDPHQEEHDEGNAALPPRDGGVSDQAVNIIDVKHRAPQLPQDQEELRRIINLIPQDIVVLDPGGRAIFANQQALEYTGLSLDEVEAGDFRERVFHPKD